MRISHLIGIIWISMQAFTAHATPKTLLEYAHVNWAQDLDLRSKTAVVIIDAQDEYLSGKLRLHKIDEAITHTKAVLEWARARGLPIIHIQQVANASSELFRQGTAAVDFIDELAPKTNEAVIQKTLPNAFARTSLEQTLREKNIEKVAFIGFMTHMCLSSTVRAALDLGFRSIVVEDATTTRDLPTRNGSIIKAANVKRVTLAALQDRFALILSSAQIAKY